MTESDASPQQTGLIPPLLAGRHALVTGGSKGIGRSTVETFAAAGATVSYCARSPESLEMVQEATRDLPGETLAYTADFSDVAEADRFYDEASARSGSPDILVHNVGLSVARNFVRMTNEDWEALFRLNLGSSLQLTRRAFPDMKRRGWGRIVMVSSATAKFPIGHLVDYSASKAAMVSVAKGLARDWAKYGILVNSVLPGLIMTPAWDEAAERLAGSGIRGETVPEVLESFSGEVPIPRFGHPDEIAKVILFLCSEWASYVNGVALDVDGGWSGHLF
ncbi:SDR family NAD(P)-dependent oxidoreductase [Candidatus Poriferisocius sp.]|uniref:SDR family NAD(P)-dependent oxidoreductase n=1 Tax=Candidatus Poriferisocius sp. TaxID=3101276 RepID=UPI003B02D206